MKEIRGFDELMKNLEQFKNEAKNTIEAAAFHGGVMVQNEAKSNHGPGAHEKGRYQDRSANLTNSIQTLPPQSTADKVAVEVVAGEEYAARIELGGTHIAGGKVIRTRPFPYLFPALEKMSGAIIDGIQGAIRKIRWVE